MKPKVRPQARRPRTAALALAVGGYALGVTLSWLLAAPGGATRHGHHETETIAASPEAVVDTPAVGIANAPRPVVVAAASEAKPRRRLPRGIEPPPQRIIDAPTYHPRDESEWQGMRVDTSTQSSCEAVAGCGLAMACIDGTCGACRSDNDCGAGESCSLDHCVQTEKVECTSSRDCGSGELCVLSGYSGGIRGNEDMRSFCQAEHGGSDRQEMDPLFEIQYDAPVEPRPISVADLRDSLFATAP